MATKRRNFANAAGGTTRATRCQLLLALLLLVGVSALGWWLVLALLR